MSWQDAIVAGLGFLGGVASVFIKGLFGRPDAISRRYERLAVRMELQLQKAEDLLKECRIEGESCREERADCRDDRAYLKAAINVVVNAIDPKSPTTVSDAVANAKKALARMKVSEPQQLDDDEPH